MDEGLCLVSAVHERNSGNGEANRQQRLYPFIQGTKIRTHSGQISILQQIQSIKSFQIQNNISKTVQNVFQFEQRHCLIARVISKSAVLMYLKSY